MEQPLGFLRRDVRVHPPQPGDEGEIFERAELVVEHRLVGQPRGDRLGGERVGARVDPENLDAAGVGRGSARSTMRSVVVLPAPLGPSSA